MLTLLSINNYHYVRGGAESVFLAHNELFAQAGWEVVPFCMKHEKNLPSDWEQYFVDEIELGSSYNFPERLTKSVKAIYSWEAQKKIGRLLRDVKPNLAHGHNIYHHISPAILSTLSKKGIPTLLTLHDLKLACPAYLMTTHDGICERCKGGGLYNAARHRCMQGSTALSIWVTRKNSTQRPRTFFPALHEYRSELRMNLDFSSPAWKMSRDGSGLNRDGPECSEGSEDAGV